MSEEVDTPEDWDYTPLADVSDVTMGSSPKSEYYNEDGDGKPFFQGNATFGFRHPTVDRYCSIDKKVANSGDILLSIRAPVGETNIADQEAVIGRGLSSISSDSLDHEFLYHALADKQQYLERISVGSTFDAISSREFNYIKVPVPPVGEQERIASVLYTVDKHVEALDQRHSSLQDLKHALMQDLLTGEKRLEIEEHEEKVWTETPSKSLDQTTVEEIPEDWSSARLSNLSEGSLYGLNESAEDDGEGMVPFIRVTNLQEHRTGLHGEMKFVDEDVVGDKTLEENDILFARSGSVGQTYLVEQENTMTYGGYMIRYRLNSERVYPRYLLQFTKSQLYWDWIERVARGGVQKNISTKEYDDLLVPLPSREEQERIASVLYTVDELITRTRELRDKYEQLKRGLMQDLLSGEVRTPEDLEPLPEMTDTN